MDFVVASKSSQDAQEEPARCSQRRVTKRLTNSHWMLEMNRYRPCIPVLAGTCPPLSLVCFLACLYLIIVDSVDIGRSMTTPLLTELIQLDLFMLAGLQLR